jgi:UDP-N-acetylglucosamine 2-epimerase (non-hydrolysing)
MKRLLFVFGTRPEAIKMAPLVKEFYKHTDKFEIKVCVTAQHRQMLDQVLDFFEITPDYDLNLMSPNQNLFSLTASVILSLKEVLDDFKPEYVFVHGDTTTSTAASISAFYSGAKVCHIEAGLRTNDKLSPFPEELNRQITSRIADVHFCPTISSKNNLLKENIQEDSIVVTGNTVIDALMLANLKLESYINDEIISLQKLFSDDDKVVLITGHRRENFGDGFLNICHAIREIAILHPEVKIVYPVHLNPNVSKPVYEILSNINNVYLIDPLGYPAFVWLMKKSYLILTDSGGIQEEAPSLGKPVLVMRDTTERPEAVEVGTVVLVGVNKNKIVSETVKLLEDQKYYFNMTNKHNPYGDGNSSKMIVEYMLERSKC